MTKQEKNIINKAIKDSLKELILKYDKVIIQQKYKDSVKCRYKIGNLDDTNFLVENHLNDEIDIFEISYIYDLIDFLTIKNYEINYNDIDSTVNFIIKNY